MAFCKTTADLDNHADKLGKKQEHEDEIEKLAAEIYDDLLGGQMVPVGNDNWTLDDFLADFDIDVCYFARFILGDSEDLRSQAKDRLNEFAENLAVKIINEVEK